MSDKEEGVRWERRWTYKGSIEFNPIIMSMCNTQPALLIYTHFYHDS